MICVAEHSAFATIRIAALAVPKGSCMPLFHAVLFYDAPTSSLYFGRNGRLQSFFEEA